MRQNESLPWDMPTSSGTRTALMAGRKPICRCGSRCRNRSRRNSAHSASLARSEEHTSELQSLAYLVCRLLLEKKKTNKKSTQPRFLALVTCMFSYKWEFASIAFCRISFKRVCFFFNDTATTEIYTLSLHDALPI